MTSQSRHPRGVPADGNEAIGTPVKEPREGQERRRRVANDTTACRPAGSAPRRPNCRRAPSRADYLPKINLSKTAGSTIRQRSIKFQVTQEEYHRISMWLKEEGQAPEREDQAAGT